MRDHLATAQRYRLRAVETRKVALTIDDPRDRAVLEKAADDYDNMAKAEENVDSERAAQYRERARALRTLARQTENKPAQAALQGVATDYEQMAFKLDGKSDTFSKASGEASETRRQRAGSPKA